MHIIESSVDDLLRRIVAQLHKSGKRISPGKGGARELIGVMLELTNPRARLSQTETRGRPFSCLGELCWYLSGSGDLSFMTYYIPNYGEFAEGDPVFGAYGPRMFHWKGTDQIANVIEMLRRRRDSRRAVVQLFDAEDIAVEHKEVPCTCTLQFLLRDGQLHLLVNMRSNDVHAGFVHDVFSFTMLQEIVARSVGAELGSYKHVVGSLHLYEEDLDVMAQFLGEGWQSANPMPDMPDGDPWRGVDALLKAETQLRALGTINWDSLKGVSPYWTDLVRLLAAFRISKNAPDEICLIRSQIESPGYVVFVDALAARKRR